MQCNTEKALLEMFLYYLRTFLCLAKQKYSTVYIQIFGPVIVISVSVMGAEDGHIYGLHLIIYACFHFYYIVIFGEDI